MMNSIPVSRESKHLLTDGPQSFLSNSAPVHPVQQIQRNVLIFFFLGSKINLFNRLSIISTEI